MTIDRLNAPHTAFQLMRPRATERSTGTPTLIVVLVKAGGVCGTRYTYADAACAGFINDIKDTILGEGVLDIASLVDRLQVKIRNSGRSGIASCGISAIDLALWDLKARIFDLPLCQFLGRAREEVDVYGVVASPPIPTDNCLNSYRAGLTTMGVVP